MSTQDFSPQTGWNVIGSDGNKVGDIDAVEQDYFIVRKGFFFPSDHYIPFSAVDSFEDGSVYLNVTKDGALDQQWSEPPVTAADAPFMGVSDDMSATATSTWPDETAIDPTLEDTADADDRVTNASGFDRPVDDFATDETTIEVREEVLGATTREVDRGAVHIDKRVVEEQQTLDVPVREEDVHVHRRAVDRPADAANFEDATYEIPVRGEEVDVTRSTHVIEEIDVHKTAQDRVETVSDTVRREEVDIDSNVDVVDDEDDRGIVDKVRDAVNPDDRDRTW